MAVSLADQHEISFYSSADLKRWTHRSDFGPAGATGGVWECPDLFPLPVDGDTKKTKWVLAVNLNPGGIAGGSGAQYFVGDFDGRKFTSDDTGTTYTPPSGTVMQDFESGSFGDWTATGDAFGSAPATGAVDWQSQVTGFEGKAFANSFHGGDASTGTLTSPEFTVSSNYINFKVGSGNHPYQPGSVLGDQPTPTGETLADFEGSTTRAADGGGPGDQDAAAHGLLGRTLRVRHRLPGPGDPAVRDRRGASPICRACWSPGAASSASTPSRLLAPPPACSGAVAGPPRPRRTTPGRTERTTRSRRACTA